MIDFFIIYIIFSYVFIFGVLVKMAEGLESKHILGSIAMVILSPIVTPFILGYGFVIIVDK